MSDPGPLPVLEQPIRVALHRRPVALKQEHPPSAPRESERRRKTGQPSPHHHDISLMATHARHHPCSLEDGQAGSDRHPPEPAERESFRQRRRGCADEHSRRRIRKGMPNVPTGQGPRTDDAKLRRREQPLSRSLTLAELVGESWVSMTRNR